MEKLFGLTSAFEREEARRVFAAVQRSSLGSELNEMAVNIKAFRELVGDALRAEALEAFRLPGIGQKVWMLPGQGDLIRFFQPQAYRRSWGFVLGGGIGIEIPALRDWLDRHKPGTDGGILRGCFNAYHISNDDALRDFMVAMGDPIPVDLWADLVRDRLSRIPASLPDLVRTYRSDRAALGWLAHPDTKPAWDFLQGWIVDPDPAAPTPRATPTGQIVWQ